MSIVNFLRWLKRKPRTTVVHEVVPLNTSTHSAGVEQAAKQTVVVDNQRQTPYAIPKREDTVIGDDAVMTGTLKVAGRLIVEGRMSGIIEQRPGGANVFVDEGAVVRGEIYASNTLVFGLVEGTITSTLISVEKMAKITGTIEYRDMRIKGGIFGVNLRRNTALLLLIEDKDTQKAISG